MKITIDTETKVITANEAVDFKLVSKLYTVLVEVYGLHDAQAYKFFTEYFKLESPKTIYPNFPYPQDITTPLNPWQTWVGDYPTNYYYTFTADNIITNKSVDNSYQYPNIGNPDYKTTSDLFRDELIKGSGIMKQMRGDIPDENIDFSDFRTELKYKYRDELIPKINNEFPGPTKL